MKFVFKVSIKSLHCLKSITMFVNNWLSFNFLVAVSILVLDSVFLDFVLTCSWESAWDLVTTLTLNICTFLGSSS